MPLRNKSRRRVLFARKRSHAASLGLLDLNQEEDTEMTAMYPLPSWIRPDAVIKDDFPTESSEMQDATAEECLPYLLGESDDGETHGDMLPHLMRRQHATFLRKMLGRLPKGFAALDASRPWMLYWCLTGLTILGEDVTSYRER